MTSSFALNRFTQSKNELNLINRRVEIERFFTLLEKKIISLNPRGTKEKCKHIDDQKKYFNFLKLFKM